MPRAAKRRNKLPFGLGFQSPAGPLAGLFHALLKHRSSKYDAHMDAEPSLSIAQRATLVLTAAAAYAVGFWPTWFVRDATLGYFGNPAYEGVWILIPHALLYSTLPAVFCVLVWGLLHRLRWLDRPSFAVNSGVVLLGLIGGAVALAATFGFIYASGQGGAVHAPQVDPWLMAGNLFSNFFEELIFRGFILVALTAALGFWPAAILSGVAFGATHTQFPMELQALIAVMGIVWAVIAARAKTIVAPYISHMLLDWVADPLL
jgi:membrane protease YdiL (CAAX protease family)